MWYFAFVFSFYLFCPITWCDRRDRHFQTSHFQTAHSTFSPPTAFETWYPNSRSVVHRNFWDRELRDYRTSHTQLITVSIGSLDPPRFLILISDINIFVIIFLWGCVLRLPPTNIFIDTPSLGEYQTRLKSASPPYETWLNPTGCQPQISRPPGC